LDFSYFHFNFNDKEVKKLFDKLITCNSNEKYELDFSQMMLPYVELKKTIFNENVSFYNTTFKEESDFSDATFKGESNFSNTTFGNGSYFSYAIFEKKPSFSDATFREESNFNNTIFKDIADFRDCIFGNINFKESIFEKKFYLSAKKEFNDIINIDFASFNFAYFDIGKIKNIPNFYKSYIDIKNTIIEDNSKTRNFKDLTQIDKNNLQFLQTLFKNNNNYENYLNYHSAELEKNIQKKLSYDNIVIWFYKIFSDYGRSVLYPLISWLLFNGGLILSSICHNCHNKYFTEQLIIKSINPIYFSKSKNCCNILSNVELFILWLQTPVNIIFIFLIILGIRNKIHMK
jgi:uncharacterized protein YjbI with pentapeptide repeats